MSDSVEYELAYWRIRGLREAIVYLLEYVGAKYKLIEYDQGKEWLAVKPSFPSWINLPYLKHQDRLLVQSNAILRYIGRQNGLCGKTEDAKAKVDVITEQVMDLRNAFVTVSYRSDGTPESYKAYVENIQTHLIKLTDLLGEQKFFAGDEVTFPDFHAFEMLDQHLIFQPSILDNYGKLKEYHARMAALPAIAAYRSSDRFRAWPLNNYSAKFGGGNDQPGPALA